MKLQNQINERVSLEYCANIVVASVNENLTRYYSAGFFKCAPEIAIFEIGSLTKLFTAHLIVILSKEEVVSLDTPLEHYLPNLKKNPHDNRINLITLRHLLTHTSGLRDPEVLNYYNPLTEIPFLLQNITLRIFTIS